MSWATMSSLLTRLGSNILDCNPNDIIKTIMSKHHGSHKKFCSESKTVDKVLLCRCEDFGSHMLIKHHLEEL